MGAYLINGGAGRPPQTGTTRSPILRPTTLRPLGTPNILSRILRLPGTQSGEGVPYTHSILLAAYMVPFVVTLFMSRFELEAPSISPAIRTEVAIPTRSSL